MRLSIMNVIFLLFVLITFYESCSSSEAGQKQSGDYDIKITYIEPCDKRNSSGDQMGFFNTKMSKPNRTHLCISGLYSLPYGLNDDMQESWELFSKGSTGGWKTYMTFKNKRACSDKKRLFPEWFQLLKLNNVPCPITKGNYTFVCHNLTGWKFSLAKELTYGEYRAKVNFYKNKKNIGCTEFRAEINPAAAE